MKLIVKNIVLVGVFNPSIFDRYSFINRGVLKEDDILPTSLFMNIGSQIITNDLNIIINPNQIVITSTAPDNKVDGINNLVIDLITKWEISNITALGFNFHWVIDPMIESLEEKSRELFYSENIKLFSEFFNNPDSTFGVYASTNYKDSRLKLDVKPMIEIGNNFANKSLHFIFNFHFEVKNLDLLKCLYEFNEYLSESENISSNY